MSKGASAFLFDPIRQKKVPATPEEHVRQAMVRYFLDDLGVPARLLVVEFDLRKVSPRHRGRLDVVAFLPGGQGLEAWAIAECKAPEVKIDESTARQLERYLAVLPCRYLVASNGQTTVTLERQEVLAFRRVPSLTRFPLGPVKK